MSDKQPLERAAAEAFSPDLGGQSSTSPAPNFDLSANISPKEIQKKTGLLTTGEMARISRNTLRTVRFYEEAGILSPAQRTDGGHRLFEYSELHKLELVSELRAAGLSLDEIRELLEVKQRSCEASTAAHDTLERLEQHVQRMTQRIDLLTKLREDLLAAKTVLQKCQTCTGNQLYPNSCGACQVIAAEADLPKTVCVVWNVRG